MSLELKGTVKVIGELQSFNDGSFTKREVLVTIDESSQYPQDIPVEVVNKNTGLFDACHLGDKVTIDINLRGSEFNGRNYVSINAWRLNITEKGAGVPTTEPAPIDDTPIGDAPDDGAGDLPF